MNPLKLFNVLNKISDQISEILQNREDLKQKYENEGIRGKLIIEDCEILFLVRRRENER